MLIFTALLLPALLLPLIFFAVGTEEKTPLRLRPLVNPVRKALDAMGEAERAEQEYRLKMAQEFEQQRQRRQAERSARQPLRATLDVDAERFLLLQEVAHHCRFEPRLSGTTLLLSRREYRRFAEYCLLAFDEPLSPEQALTRLGLSLQRER